MRRHLRAFGSVFLALLWALITYITYFEAEKTVYFWFLLIFCVLACASFLSLAIAIWNEEKLPKIIGTLIFVQGLAWIVVIILGLTGTFTWSAPALTAGENLVLELITALLLFVNGLYHSS